MKLQIAFQGIFALSYKCIPKVVFQVIYELSTEIKQTKQTLGYSHQIPVFGYWIFLYLESFARCFGHNFIADCSSRNLTSIPTGFSQNTSEIFLQNNQIHEIKENDFRFLPNLQFLYLQDNEITRIEEKAFSEIAATIKFLALHGNKIKQLSENTFTNMNFLKSLNINNNNLKTIKKNLFKDLVSVVQLSACGNDVGSIQEDFDDLSLLRYVGFSQNKLNAIPSELGKNAPDLYVLDYADNQLVEPPVIPSTVRQVYINGNTITRVEPKFLRNASNLDELYLNENQIDAIESGTFQNSPRIEWLDLTGNMLSEANSSMFEHLNNMKGIFLTRNRHLHFVSKDAFRSSKDSLTRLLIDDCNLTNLDPAVITTIENEGLYVWAGNNPWNCDCDIKALSDLIYNDPSMFYDLSSMQCGTPDAWSGRSLINITFNLRETCSEDYSHPYDETALIVSMSILGAVIVSTVAIFFIYKDMKRKTTVEVTV